MYNLGKGGLTYWSPNINVVRDPRWGRALETPGEDPFVAGRYAVNFVRGMQDIPGHDTGSGGDLSTRPIKTSACCKHYAAYDVDDWHNHTRFTFDARVSERDMAETFLRPFEMCVRDGDASSVMCSYNRVNGIPTCADARLLSGTIRGDWQLHGYIVSDCDAIRVMTDNATWLNFTGAESSAASLRAGLDLDCAESWIEEKGRPLRDFLSEYGKAAVAQGKMRESDIDNALRNQYMTLMRLGYFDNIPRYASLNETDICTDDHRSLAHDGARQGIVLLKNNDNLLPLDPEKILAVAVHGPHARAPEKVMDGDYTGQHAVYQSSSGKAGRRVNDRYSCIRMYICRTAMPVRHAAPRYKQGREDLAQGEYDHLLGWHKPSHREGGKRQGGSSPTQEPNRGDPTLCQGLTEPDHPCDPVWRRH
jgi:beta-glucosidase-like glycosyl hydrolase